MTSWQLHLLWMQWRYQARRLARTDTLPMRQRKHEQMARYLTDRLVHDIIQDKYAVSCFLASPWCDPISYQRLVHLSPNWIGTERATYED